MKRSILSVGLLLLFNSSSFAQVVNYAYLDINNIRAHVCDNGMFFHKPATLSGGYEYPKNSGLNLMYTSGFWFGGRDINNQLKFSGQVYDSTDFGPGPLTIDGTAQPATITSFPIWKINKAEVDYHIAHFSDVGYVIPQDFVTWPAHGDVSQGFSYNLAPYVDVNSDNVYNPGDGDYPCIKGDQAVYTILNDRSGSIANSYSIGLELHYMFYQINDPSTDLDNTTFIDLTLINRSTQTLFDFNASYFVDGDIGNYSDDFLGCDSTSNIAYFYNGDNDDQANAGLPGYGPIPPAFAIATLNNPMTNFSYYPLTSTTPAEKYDLMNGYWAGSVPFTNLDGQPTDFIYSGDPLLNTGDTEIEEGNPPGDRRALMSTNFGTLEPFEILEMSYAIIVEDNDINAIENAHQLIDQATNLRSFWSDNLDFSCFNLSAGINEQVSTENFEIFPNPSNGNFSVRFDKNQQYVNVMITDISGRTIHEEKYINTGELNLTLTEPNGVYLLTVESESGTIVKRIVKE